MRCLKRARNRPLLPWRWREHGSERPDSPDNHEAVLTTPAGSAELPHTANGAGHTASRDASNRPQHARIAGVARGEARRAATGRGGGLRTEPQATPFFPSRALGPMLPPSPGERWPVSCPFQAAHTAPRQMSGIVAFELGTKEWWLPPPLTPTTLIDSKALRRWSGRADRSSVLVPLCD